MSEQQIPAIRFKDYDDEWDLVRLEDVKDVRDGTHDSPKYHRDGYPLITSKNLTDTGLDLENVSLISQRDYIEINRRSKVEKGDILLGLIGTIGKPVLVNKEGFAIKNVGLIKSGGVLTNEFLIHFLKGKQFDKYIKLEMAGNTQKFLGLGILRNTKVPTPSLPEQSAIGSLFQKLDRQIALHQDKLALMKAQKQTYLRLMFPQKEQKVPELRFQDFTGEWESGRLGNLSSFAKGSGYSKSSLVDNGNPIVLYGRLYTKYETVIDNIDTFATLTSKSVLSLGGEVIVPSSGESAKDIARASVVKGKGVILAGDLNIIKPQKHLNSIFLALTISNGEQQKELSKRSQGKSVVHLHNSDLKEVNLQYPTLSEQTAIGNFFQSLDKAIELQENKIAQLREQKKSLLSKMFI